MARICAADASGDDEREEVNSPTSAPGALNFRGESMEQARNQLVSALVASKSWMGEYAQAYVDDFMAMARGQASSSMRAEPPPTAEVPKKIISGHDLPARIRAGHPSAGKAGEADERCPNCYDNPKVSYCGRCGKGAVL